MRAFSDVEKPFLFSDLAAKRAFSDVEKLLLFSDLAVLTAKSENKKSFLYVREGLDARRPGLHEVDVAQLYLSQLITAG